MTPTMAETRTHQLASTPATPAQENGWRVPTIARKPPRATAAADAAAAHGHENESLAHRQ